MFKNNCKHSWIARVMKLLKPVLTLRKFVMMLDFKIWKIPLYVLKYGHCHLKGKLNFINNKEITSFCKKLFVHINHHHLLNEYVFYNLFPVGKITCSKLTIETAEKCEICSKLTIKTPERRQWPRVISEMQHTKQTKKCILEFAICH